ncbi:DUF402 domain-containing protein [Halobacteriaceae bacterium SHR40]|uniref:DUF402 domain-containing protein n=1 Tax=Halovenus amylolytica TaxID=2500550 RepID=UPI000FE30302
MTVRVRGIYTTALTALFDDVVQASPAIRDRFDDSFSMAPAESTVETTADRQGIGVHDTSTDSGAYEAAIDRLSELALDTLAWQASLPRGGIFAGAVVETLGSGAVLECATADDHPPASSAEPSDPLPADDQTAGFLPYSKTADRVEEGDRLLVQVTESQPPWSDDRPLLDTTIRVEGGLATLTRGGTTGSGQPDLADILPAETPEGWAISWDRTADDADLDELSAVIETLGARAETVDEALADHSDPGEMAPYGYHRGDRTVWFWFGRESRFALDEKRRSATTTMVGHHRIKAGAESASMAVDFVERICGDVGSEFPFDVVTGQFGPQVGDAVSIGHGKPAGHVIDLGPGEVTDRGSDGKLTVEREMSSRGTYDALGTKREPGDVATTKFTEGRWWYPTVYRRDGTSKGTYVNICTPVEVFPSEVRYVDLHVDVVKKPDGTVERVDDDELTAAVAADRVPEPLAEKARKVASAVENAL